jgi:hypothetical protein
MQITIAQSNKSIRVIQLPEEVVETLDKARNLIGKETQDFADVLEVVIFDLYKQMLLQHPTPELLEKRKKFEAELMSEIDSKIQKLRGK